MTIGKLLWMIILTVYMTSYPFRLKGSTGWKTSNFYFPSKLLKLNLIRSASSSSHRQIFRWFRPCVKPWCLEMCVSPLFLNWQPLGHLHALKYSFLVTPLFLLTAIFLTPSNFQKEFTTSCCETLGYLLDLVLEKASIGDNCVVWGVLKFSCVRWAVG